MPRNWTSEKGKDFTCPHCGSVYETTLRHIPAQDSDVATCRVCGEVMDEWNGTAVPSYRLKVRREPGVNDKSPGG